MNLDAGVMPGASPIEALLDRAAEGLRRPIEKARGLPNEAFTSEAFLEAENQRLFPRCWVFAGLASDVPEAGDVMPVAVAGRNLFLLRGAGGAVRVFHNVCPHRGARLVPEPLSGKSYITCPYHGWSFNLDGEVASRPHYFGPEIHDRTGVHEDERACLFPVRSETMLDWVFVNLDGEADPFDDYMRPITDCFADFDLTAFKPAASLNMAVEFRCNWKLALENFHDYYHVFKVHPALHKVMVGNRRHSMESDGVHLFNGYWFTGETLGLSLDDSGPTLPKDLHARHIHAHIFPNVEITYFPSNLQITWFEALGADRTRMHMRFYFVGDAATDDAHREARQTLYDDWIALNAEDEGVCALVQEGRAGDAYDGGRLVAYWDTSTVHYQTQVVDAMRGAGAFART
jgi:choline monooxygenase